MSIRDLFTKDDERDAGIHNIVGDSGAEVTDYSAYEKRESRTDFESNTQVQKINLNDIASIENDPEIDATQKQKLYTQVVNQGVNEESTLQELISFNVCNYYLTGDLQSLLEANALNNKLTTIQANTQGPQQEFNVPNAASNLIRKEMLNLAKTIFQDDSMNQKQKLERKEMKVLLNAHSIEQALTPIDKMYMLIVQDLAGETNIELDKAYKEIISANPELAPEMQVFQSHIIQKKRNIVQKQQQRSINKNRSQSWAPTMSIQ